MDKQAQEKIAQELARQDDELIWEHLKPEIKAIFLFEANKIINLLKELGYRKLPKDKHCDKHSKFSDECPWCHAVANEGIDWEGRDKPPKLSGKRIYEIAENSKWALGTSGVPYWVELCLEAQRTADIKHYEGL